MSAILLDEKRRPLLACLVHKHMSEWQLQAKAGAPPGTVPSPSGFTKSPALEFERSDATRKLQLVLSELLELIARTGGRLGLAL